MRRAVESKPRTAARAWWESIRRAARAFVVDQCPDRAAGLTFYAVLALVPAAMVAFSVVSILGRAVETARTIEEVVLAIAPSAEPDAVTAVLARIAEARLSGFLLVVALGITLWSVARFIASLGRAMNRIYGVDEGRPLWTLKLVKLLLALFVIVATTVLALVLLASDEASRAIGDAVGLEDVTLQIWRIARWPSAVLIAVLLLAVLYFFAPNVRPARFRWVGIGALVALAALAVATAGFLFYVTAIADYDRLYGAFGGVIVFSLWAWIASMALLVGAEFDAELERVRQLRQGIPSERQVQVELRDARRIAVRVRRDRTEERAARRIRR
ncbi:YihY/virulence factor BrkB family protein [Microbacterium sp. GXF6406]